jgi:hypothetical protein
VSAGALTALSRLLPTLHLADWTNKEAIVNTLLNTLMDCSSSSSMLAVTAAEAAGFVGVTLLQQHADAGGLVGFKEAGDRGLGLACSCLGLLLSCFTATFSSSSSSSTAATAAVAKLPGSCRDLVMLQELRFSDDVLQNPDMAAAALRGCFAVLAALQKTLQSAGPPPPAAAGVLADFVLQQLSAATASSHGSGRSPTAVAVAAAAPAAAAAAAAAAAGASGSQHLAAVSAQLQRLVTGNSGDSSDARVCAAAAVSWAQLVVLQLAAATGTEHDAQVGAALHSRTHTSHATLSQCML